MRVSDTIKLEDFKNETFFEKINILKEFWNNRNREMIGTVSGLKKQKMLVFYNLFSFVNGKHYTINKLAAFEDGPVYADIHSHIKIYPGTFLEKIAISKKYDINQEEFLVTLFMLEALSEDVLSKLTHSLDLWSNKEVNGDDSILENDITEHDRFILATLFEHYRDIAKEFDLYKNELGIIALEKLNKDVIINDHYDKISNIYNSMDLVLISMEDGEVVYG